MVDSAEIDAFIQSAPCHKRIVRADGEVRYFRCVSGPLVENQSLKKYVGSAIDVTEQEPS
jgi:PAS domain-containing protein